MTTHLQALPAVAIGADTWNAFALASDDAWFWHTTQWLEFVAEVGRSSHLGDLSFGIVKDGKLSGICPVVLEDRDGFRRLTYLGEFIPCPAFANDLDAAQRTQLLAWYAGELDRLAAENAAAYTRVAVPALAPRRNTPSMPSINPLVRLGFLDLGWMTQIVDLDVPEDALWHDIRKGHRSDIKRAARDVSVSIWDRETITPERFAAYQALHAKAAGRVTRTQRSFDIMREWIETGQAILAEASIDGRAVACAIQIVFGAGAYYASGCKDPDFDHIPAAHAVQWECVRWLKAHGIRHYDIGVQHFSAQWIHVPTEADLGIAAFKRGFGGRTAPIMTAEKFYSAEMLDREIQRRRERLVRAQS